jgi:glucose/arabinose dehydrogenase
MRRLLWLLGFCWLIMPVLAQDEVFTHEPTNTRYRLETYVNANFPVGMAFAPDGRLFYNEKITGSVRVVLPDGTVQSEPVITLPTDALQERGMLGLALSPQFETDSTIYVVHTLEGTTRDYPANRLVRFTIDENNIGGAVEELLKFPITTGELLHNGGNIHFDEAGYLYLSLGDFGDATNAQNINTPQGAIHRFEVTDEDVIPAAANPFGDDNSVYAYGLRNPFDFTIDPFSDWLFAAEVGANCDDEIDVIQAGGNYGWSDTYECIGTGDIPDLADYVPPMLSFTPVISPTGIVVYDGAAFPEWQGDLIFCDWNFGKMRRVVLDELRTRALEVHEIDLGATMCRIDLVLGLDGSLYFGTVDNEGGRIVRLTPETKQE